ncbi:Protocadherin Fat 4 [Merluccius polli]|uniref:Protocadherin Fat 4 n=1 Tax=Merluccius polli TaxID=89951 RepID=A0AA47MND8_MERPO|nr:Protocadherin Fat 4 [Merluccius polli]
MVEWIMAVPGPWRVQSTLLSLFMMLGSTWCIGPPSPRGVDGAGRRRQRAGPVQDVHPTWDNGSTSHGSDPGLQYALVAHQSSERRQRQMPLVQPVSYSFQAKEDTAPGAVVGRVQAAYRDNARPITYSVLEDNGDQLFLLNRLSGDLLLSRGLDFETQSFYILTVGWQEEGRPLSSVRVYFNVLDVNDNPPEFEPDTYSASLLEDVPAGTCFLLLNVADRDAGENSDLDLQILAGDDERVFSVDPAGKLCLNSELDREKKPSYNLTVTASDRPQISSQRFTSTAQVVISVHDVNDNPPVFMSAQSVAIPEDSALHLLITTIQAEDADSGSNGDVFYYLNDSLSSTWVSVHNTSGHVYLQRLLDREQADAFTVAITAVDNGFPRMASTMNLTMHVEDVNDHTPEFPQRAYSLVVREDIPRGSSVFQAQAWDADLGANGEVRYTLSQTSPFAVDAVRGVIVVTEELDRERQSNYTLTVTAEDRGSPPRSSAAVIGITVSDVNDFTPVFSPATQTVHVMENEEDLSQFTQPISAWDDDVGINSQLKYLIQSGNEDSCFSLSPNGTFHVLNSLDREKEPLYILSIIAVDAGWPPLTGTLTMEVVVNDENDNRPRFHEDVYNTIVPEDNPAGAVFAIITATDLDEGVNGEIRYTIVGPDSPFSIEETSGELSTTDVLDRETVAIYNLTVIGSDKHPSHPLSSSVLVNVLVGDVNDHWPQFQNSPYVAHVPTEMDPESVVCAVRATDRDIEMNAELQFSLYGPSVELFKINPRSGTVFTSSFLTGTDGLTIDVHVEDSGEVPHFDVTTISVMFHNSSEFPVVNVDVVTELLSEDMPVGALVAIVNATSPRPGPFYFYLASGDTDKMFQMDESSGELTVQHPLDYESKKDFTLLVEARDSGSPPFSSFAEIHINISDVNDNFPQFMQSEFRCEIFENSLPIWVCDVFAIDADSKSYGMVQYSIVEGNPDSHFIVDSENGELSTTLSLDREDIAEYNLTVEATDQDNPLNRARATVIVVVLDRNDHAPRFSQIFMAEVPEDAPIGHTVLQVISADDDIDDNAEITYSIIQQSHDIPFRIDNTNGFITVMGQLDREKQDHYIVRVNANDSAWSISTDVTLVLLDVNDNKPVFSHTFPTVNLPETKAQEEFVFRVIATDADTGKNSEVVYNIEPPDDHFWVNATSGEIYTSQPMVLHHSTFEVFNLTVFAYDCGITSLFGNTTVMVRLVPYNYHPPTFLHSPSKMSIPFDLPIGTEVVQFSAVDKDSNHSPNEIEYGLKNGNASDWFWIQADNGKVTLNGSLREHLSEVLTLSVTAKDSGYPPLSSQVEITFEIIARNHFSPNFVEPYAVFSIPEDFPVGSVIGKIQAEDEDSGANGVVTYSIRQELEYLPFSLGKRSALLSLIRELDFEKQRLYHFQIEAVDGGWSSKMGITNITVNIVDVNDNPPSFGALEYVASVPENSGIGTIVFIAKATDPDSTTNAQLTYSLISGDVERFSVDSVNGTITTADIFDYEQEQIFDVMVKVSNMGGQGLFSVAHVVIQILDINEFIPTFKTKEYNFSVFTHDPIGTRVGKVTATDFDQGPEGEVFYLLFGLNKNMGFEIDRHSGDIYTTGSLRMHGNSPAVLTVLAKNRGVISGTNVDEGSVRISIIEMNNAPEFTPTLYSTNVRENIAVGTSVVRVSALDKDSIWYWSQFSFSIEQGNKNTAFVIHPLSGVISVNSPLDREQLAHYNLSVTATDKGTPPATGTANVLVTVDDVNDNAPTLGFTQAQVKENQPHGTIVARLNASDLDLPPNQGPFTFWVVKPMMGSAFSLTADGVLFTTRSMDREAYSVYHVPVAVRDAGTPPLTSTTVFHISVMDENDNPHMQRNIHIEVKYYGSSFQGGRIGHVTPQGDDESYMFNCSIKTGRSNMFDIPYGTCELWSAPFQGEATYNITIEATDQFLFPVNNSVYVNYKGFTNASMDSCILFYVSSSSIHEFLTHNYLRFVKALDSLFNLKASKTHVFGIKVLDTEILLLAAVKSYNGQYLSREVASGISTGHKKVLEAQTNVTISHITSDPCLTDPCQNGATCGKNIHIGPNVAVLESSTVIFVSPQMEIFNCTCSAGFTGTLCEADIDECESNPCKNKGTCVNNHGGFYCHCQNGFFGPSCATDFDECPTEKCQNGGSCVNAQDGIHCLCDAGYKGSKYGYG